MNPIPNLKNIAFQQIDLDDLSYCISPEQAIAGGTSAEAIALSGVLHPPVVRETGSGYYTVVAGRKRLLALHEHFREAACACLVLSRRTPEVDVFRVLLEEILLTRECTAIEKAVFLHKVAAVAGEQQIIDEFLPRLDLAPHSSAMQRTLKLLNLEEPLLRGIHRGQIHETVAHGLVLLSPEDRRPLGKIITSLRLSFSNQKKLLTLCRALASRDNTSIAGLLDSEEVQEILQHREANPPQITKNLLLWLSRRQMPRLSQAREEFSRFARALHLPENVSVTHTPCFEDDAVVLSISFPDRKSLQDAWKKIRHATTDSDN